MPWSPGASLAVPGGGALGVGSIRYATADAERFHPDSRRATREPVVQDVPEICELLG